MRLPIIVYLDRSEKMKWNGTMMHVYEIGMRLRDWGFKVFAIINPKHEKIYNSRYLYPLPTMANFSELGRYQKYVCLSYKFPEFELSDKCVHYLKVVTDLEANKWPLLLSHNPLLLPKVILLIANNLDQQVINEIPTNVYNNLDRGVVYDWGIYTKAALAYDFNQPPPNKWLLYTRKDMELSDEETIERARQWADEQRLDIDEDPEMVINPHLKYKGLLYTKHTDFSGRLPFEFASVNKPIVAFDWPANMDRLASYERILFKNPKPHIIKHIPKLNMYSKPFYQWITQQQ